MTDEINRAIGRIEGELKANSDATKEVRDDVKALLAAHNKNTGMLRAAAVCWGILGGLCGSLANAWISLKGH